MKAQRQYFDTASTGTGEILMLWIFFVIAGTFFLTFFLRERTKKASARSLICKTLASVCFLGVAMAGLVRLVGRIGTESWYTSAEGLAEVSVARGPILYGVLVLAGLFFGTLGDIALDLKWNCPKEDVTYTYAGFVSFAIGHVFYIAALTRRFGAGLHGAWLIVPFALAAALGLFIGLNGRLFKVDYGRFLPITIVYAAVLISTTLLAGSLTLATRFRHPATLLFFVGGVLFLISDLILSGTYFGEGKRRPKDIISNHIFYYAAQFLIAASVLAS